MKKNNIIWEIFLVISINCLIANATPLDDYVYKPDDHYRYEIIKQYIFQKSIFIFYFLMLIFNLKNHVQKYVLKLKYVMFLEFLNKM